MPQWTPSMHTLHTYKLSKILSILRKKVNCTLYFRNSEKMFCRKSNMFDINKNIRNLNYKLCILEKKSMVDSWLPITNKIAVYTSIVEGAWQEIAVLHGFSQLESCPGTEDTFMGSIGEWQLPIKPKWIHPLPFE
jgi:hypothetical protein